MTYVKPQVQLNNEVSINEVTEWFIVSMALIVAIGGAYAYCLYKGGDFVGEIKLSEFYVKVGCDLP